MKPWGMAIDVFIQVPFAGQIMVYADNVRAARRFAEGFEFVLSNAIVQQHFVKPMIAIDAAAQEIEA